jgi:hypothetical protein
LGKRFTQRGLRRTFNDLARTARGDALVRRLTLDCASRDELLACLDHLLVAAGNPFLMTSELCVTLADHAAGNYRVLMNLGDELLTSPPTASSLGLTRSSSSKSSPRLRRVSPPVPTGTKIAEIAGNQGPAAGVQRPAVERTADQYAWFSSLSRVVLADVLISGILFPWCDAEAPWVLDETPISDGIRYARNQRVGLWRFLDDGRLPVHSNLSKLNLRREAFGRKNGSRAAVEAG